MIVNRLNSFFENITTYINSLNFSKREKILLCVLITAIFTLYLFKFSLLHKNFWGHQWLTHHTVLILRNWVEQNPFSNFFALISEPLSIEASVGKQYVYTSYPPGAFIIPYIAVKILHIYPSVKFVEVYSIVNQFLASIFICLTSLNITKNSDIKTRYIAAVICFSTYMLSFGSSYYNFFSYFSDTAVLFPVSYLLFYMTFDRELILRNSIIKHCFVLFSSFIFFLGAMTDPFFYIVAFVFIAYKTVYNIRNKNFNSIKKEIVVVIVPCILAIIFYTGQIVYLDQFEKIFHKFIERTGFIHNEHWANNLSFTRFLSHFFTLDLVLIIITILFSVVRKNIILILFIISCIIHLLIFSQHSKVHSFTTVKFLLFLSFSMGLIYESIPSVRMKKFYIYSILIYFFIAQFNVSCSLANSIPLDNYLVRIANKISHAKYNDVFISNFYEIAPSPPHLLTVSKKRLWNTRERGILAERLKDVAPTSYRIHAIIPVLEQFNFHFI